MAGTLLYPYGTQALLTPENRTEPVIRPVQVIFHSHGMKATNDAIGRYFDRDDVNIESTASIGYDGEFREFQYLDRQADANAKANGWSPAGGGLFGAISLEHEGVGGDEPFTHEQVVTDALFLAWANLHLGIPLTPVGKWDSPGIGYHSMFREWNPNGHVCPGRRRVKQIYDEIIPGARWLVSQSDKRSTDIVDRIDFVDGKGAWLLQRDGGVITKGTAPFYGSYPGLGSAATQGGVREFGRIAQTATGGYVLVATSGERYQFDPPSRG